MAPSSSVLFLLDSHDDDLQRISHIADQFHTQAILAHEWDNLSESLKDLHQYTTVIMAFPDSIDVRLSRVSLSTHRVSERVSGLLSWLCNHQEHIHSVNFLIIVESNTNSLASFICTKLQELNAKMLSSDILSFTDNFTGFISQILPTPSKEDARDIVSGIQPASSSVTNKKPSRQALIAARKRLAAQSISKPVLPNPSLSVTLPSSPVHTANVLTVRQLLKHPSGNASTVEVVLDVGDNCLEYTTAGNIGIHPRNDDDIVIQLCRLLTYDPDAIVSVPRRTTPCSVREAFLWDLDIMSPPRRSFVKFLAQFASNADEKERLANMAEKHSYNEHFVMDKKTLLELLEMFLSVKPPLDIFIQQCPRLLPRMFTISSSTIVNPSQIHLTVSRTRIIKSRDRIHNGVCSTYLTNLIPGKDTCLVFARKSSFFVPDSRPVIMCGTGAGIAPFRAFIQEAAHRCQTEGVRFPEWHLFFGCRRREDGFLYEDELVESVELGILEGLHLAFSRNDPERKVYIQDRLKEHQDMVWKLIDQENAIVFICGSTQMGKDVLSRFRDIVVTKTGCSADKAELYMTRLAEERRLFSELWG